MLSKNKNRLKLLPWTVVADGLTLTHWNLIESSSRRKIFERGNDKIIAVKLAQNKWKAEYFENGRLMDTSGIAEEEFVKRIICEMGFLR